MTFTQTQTQRRPGFTLIELLVILGIIGLLVGLLVPALGYARQQGRDLRCRDQLRQIYTAFTAYLGNYNDTAFWHGKDLVMDGMDRCTYGGRETGNANLGQQGIFNRFVPRPLNPYLAHAVEVFRCPEDRGSWRWADNHTFFDWVGNCYNFNCDGDPGYTFDDRHGFAGIHFGKVSEPARTILFFDANYDKSPDDWHRGQSNICLADGHIVPYSPPGFNEPAPYKWTATEEGIQEVPAGL